jgi:hypothetical protein
MIWCRGKYHRLCAVEIIAFSAVVYDGVFPKTPVYQRKGFARVKGDTRMFTKMRSVFAFVLHYLVATAAQQLNYRFGAPMGEAVPSWVLDLGILNTATVLSGRNMIFVVTTVGPFGSESSNLTALTSTGQWLWSEYGPGDRMWSFNEDRGVVLWHDRSSRFSDTLCGVECWTGVQKWCLQNLSQPLITSPGLVVASQLMNGSDSLFIYDVLDGSLLWNTPLTNATESYFFGHAYESGVLYLAIFHQLVAVDLMSRVVMWQRAMPSGADQIIPCKGRLYAVVQESASLWWLLAMNATTSTTLWTRRFDARDFKDSGSLSGVLTSNGTLIVLWAELEAYNSTMTLFSFTGTSSEPFATYPFNTSHRVPRLLATAANDVFVHAF